MEIAQDRHARFQAGELLKLSGQAQGIPRVLKFQLLQFGFGLGHCGFGFRFGHFFLRRAAGNRVLPGNGAFGHGDDAEAFPAGAAPADGSGHAFHVVRDFGNQDDVRAAGHACAQRQPAHLVAHDLHHHDTVMAVGRAMQPVDGFRRHAEGRIEPESDVRQGHVVVNRLGQRDDIQPLLRHAVGVLLRAAAAQAHQHVQVMLLVVLHHHVGHVHQLAAHGHAVRLIAAGAQDGAAQREDAR